MDKQTWICVMMEMSPFELMIMAQVCTMFRMIVLENPNVWERHVKRVLYWCPRVAELFILDPSPYKVFTKYLFPPYIETLKRYSNDTTRIVIIADSVFRVNVPRNRVQSVIIRTHQRELLFECTIFARGAREPFKIFMGKHARCVTMNLSAFDLTCKDHQAWDEAFGAIVWDGDARKYETPKVYSFESDEEEERVSDE